MIHNLTLPKLDCLGCSKPGKCCDFQPFLPNYLLGQMLEAGIELPAAGDHSYQPIGLVPGKGFRERHALLKDGERGDGFLCRFYDLFTQRCSVYEFRPAECRFYFCEGMTGEIQRRSEVGFAAETQLAQLCLKQIGFVDDEIHAQVDVLNLESEPDAVSENNMRLLYRRAWNWAGQLGAKDVDQLI